MDQKYCNSNSIPFLISEMKICFDERMGEEETFLIIIRIAFSRNWHC